MDAYKILGKSIREYKRSSFEAPLYVSLEVVLECVIPFIVSKLVNQIQAGGNFRDLLLDGIILILMAFASLTFGILAGNACSTAACGFAKNLRSDLFKAIQAFSFENIDKFSAASLVTRVTTDVSNVQNAYMMLIRTAVRGPFMLIFSFVMALIMGGKIALIFLFSAPLLGLGLFAIARWAMPVFKRLFKRYDDLNASIQENIAGIRVVKSFVREENEKEKFNSAASSLCNDFTRVERILALNNPLMQFCIYSATLFILYYGSYLTITSRGLDLNVGQISALLTYSAQILGTLMRLSMIFVMITMARESAVRIAEVLTEQSVLSGGSLSEIKDGSIEFKDVNFAYASNPKNLVLNNINLKINSGETIGLLGGTGSSKSSLVQLIPRLYDAVSGKIYVGGVDVRQYNLDFLRSKVAVVLQKNEIFSGTIRDNLLWGDANASESEIREACRLACADEFIDKLPERYDTFIEQNGTNLSGGQKQRLCIARALLKKPAILILDDSTSALDNRTDNKIRAALKEFLPGTTKIIIAQRISSVQDADRIIVMNGGMIDAIGSHSELLQRSKIYQEIYASQNSES